MSFSNYAVPNSPLNSQPFRDDLGNFSLASRVMFEQAPEAGYEQYIRSLFPSFANDQALRRLYNVFRTRYDADVARGGAPESGTRWMDWLARQDPNRELARLPAEYRGEQPGRFSRPARYVAF